MRFLQRLWRNVVDENTGEVRVTDGKLDTKTLKLLNNTIADVTVEMEAMRPNTAIAKLIVLNNHLTSLDAVPRAAVEPLILMLSPIAPHICEELWSKPRPHRIPRSARRLAEGRRTLRRTGFRHRGRADQGQGARQARGLARHRS